MANNERKYRIWKTNEELLENLASRLKVSKSRALNMFLATHLGNPKKLEKSLEELTDDEDDETEDELEDDIVIYAGARADIRTFNAFG